MTNIFNIVKIDKEEILTDGSYTMQIKGSDGRKIVNAKLKRKKTYNPDSMKNGWDRFDSAYPSNPLITETEDE